jgi:hypothetical protein
MMRQCSTILNILVMVTFLFTPGMGRSAASEVRQAGLTESGTGLYRTRVTFPNASAPSRLVQLGVVVLSEEAGGALVLAAGDQLATLARLGFKPQGSNELWMLVTANAQVKPWLADELAVTLGGVAGIWAPSQAALLAGEGGVDKPASAETQAALDILHTVLVSLSAEQKAGIQALAGVDDDGDGLSNTEEG